MNVRTSILSISKPDKDPSVLSVKKAPQHEGIDLTFARSSPIAENTPD